MTKRLSNVHVFILIKLIKLLQIAIFFIYLGLDLKHVLKEATNGHEESQRYSKSREASKGLRKSFSMLVDGLLRKAIIRGGHG